MKFWILIIAYHGGGNITMQPWGQYPTLHDCTEVGRQIQKEKISVGYRASIMCQEVKR